MKRIVIACDGTWNRLDSRHPTNVVRLTQAVLTRGSDGIAQVTLHLDGVGVGRGTGAIARGIDRGLGGLFGLGLMANVEAAYRFLVFNYAPGDDIYLFGFSRGAYTARTLGGLIRNCGILERDQAAAIPQALALYQSRDPDAHPDGAAALDFRARHAAHVVTGPDENAWRMAETGGTESAGESLRIKYVGVWDTVGALGVPRRLWLARSLNRDLEFHDTRLSRAVGAARHAVATDELRRAFPPTLWSNLDGPNTGWPPTLARYQQRWFPGDHGAVGGGGEVRTLSSDALLWVAEGAVISGLGLDPAALAAWSAERDAMGPLNARGKARASFLARCLALDTASRTGPDRPDDLAEATRIRWRRDAGYRPATLARVAHWLDTGRTGGAEREAG